MANTIELIRLAIPGFVFLVVFRWYAPSRTKSGWEYLVLVVLVGGMTYGTARVVVRWMRPIRDLDGVRDLIDVSWPGQPDNGTYVLALLCALALGVVLPLILRTDFATGACRRLGMWHPPTTVDLLMQLLRDGKFCPMVVSTTQRQVNIGQLVQVTTEPEEGTKILVIKVFMGGSRIEESSARGGSISLRPAGDEMDQDIRTTVKVLGSTRLSPKVKYNYYIDHTTSNPGTDADGLTYLNFKDVVSVTQFGVPEFKQTLASGYSDVSDEILLGLLLNVMAYFPWLTGQVVTEFPRFFEENPPASLQPQAGKPGLSGSASHP